MFDAWERSASKNFVVTMQNLHSINLVIGAWQMGQITWIADLWLVVGHAIILYRPGSSFALCHKYSILLYISVVLFSCAL